MQFWLHLNFFNHKLKKYVVFLKFRIALSMDDQYNDVETGSCSVYVAYSGDHARIAQV